MEQNDIIKVITLIELEKFDQAISILKSILSINPDNTQALQIYGTCLINTGEHKKAQTIIEQLEEIGDYNYYFYYLKGLLANATGKFNVAIESLKIGLAMRPDSSDILMLLSIVYLKEDHFWDAKKYAKLVLELEPDNARTLLLLSGIEKELGNVELSEKYFEHSIDVDFDDEVVLSVMANKKFANEEYAEARELYQQVLVTDSGDYQILERYIDSRYGEFNWYKWSILKYRFYTHISYLTLMIGAILLIVFFTLASKEEIGLINKLAYNTVTLVLASQAVFWGARVVVHSFELYRMNAIGRLAHLHYYTQVLAFFAFSMPVVFRITENENLFAAAIITIILSFISAFTSVSENRTDRKLISWFVGIMSISGLINLVYQICEGAIARETSRVYGYVMLVGIAVMIIVHSVRNRDSEKFKRNKYKSESTVLTKILDFMPLVLLLLVSIIFQMLWENIVHKNIFIGVVVLLSVTCTCVLYHSVHFKNRYIKADHSGKSSDEVYGKIFSRLFLMVELIVLGVFGVFYLFNL